MTTIKHPSGDRHWARRRPDLVLRGSAAPGAKLTESQRETIRAFVAANPDANFCWLARHYGVSRMTIWRIAGDLRV